MRMTLAIPLLFLGACQVSKDDANDTVSVSYNEDVAANVGADVANTAEDIAGDISNDVERTAEKVQNADIDVTVNRDVQTNGQ
jgi:hypothetical protein